MKHTRIFALIILISILKSNVCVGQSGEIKIRYIGNCGLHITDGETHLYTDFPYKSGAHHYAEYEDTELDNLMENAFFIFTHKHSDHYYKGKMNKIMKEKKGKKYGKWDIAELESLNGIIPDFKIEAFKTRHQFSFAHYSYLITWHGKRIYLSGDTEWPETILKMKGLDWAFLPSWLYKNIWDDKLNVDTRMLGIYHIGPNDDVRILRPNIVMLKEQGEVFTLTYDN